MTVRFEVDRPAGVYGVTLPAYKWGYTEVDRERVSRDLGTTPCGTKYDERQPYAIRELVVRFIEADAVLAQLNTLSYFAMRLAQDVRFYPNFDTAPGTYRDIDWATELAFSRVLDNRQEVEVRIIEKAVEL